MNLELGNTAEKGRLISNANDIITNALKASLDFEKGGDLTLKLAALYDYMTQRLLWGNLKNDPAALDEVMHLLGEIHGAWVEIAPGSVRAA